MTNKNKESNTSRDYSISEDDLQKLFNEISIGFALCELLFDKNGNPSDYRFLRFNSAFEKQTGMRISSFIGKTVKKIYPDIEESWIERYSSVVFDKKPIHFVDYNHNTDKTYSVNSHFFSENKFVLFFEDISELTESKKNLIKSEKKYNSLFNFMTGICMVIDLVYDEDGNAIDYVILRTSLAFEKLVNKKRKEILGKRAKEIFDVVEDYWIKTFEKVEKTGEPENFDNYGAELDKYYQTFAWKVDKGQVAVVFTDITNIKKSEEALKVIDKQNKDFIKILNESQGITHSGNWEWNLLDNEVKWSDMMYELLGYNPNSVIPSYELAFKHVHPDDKERYEKLLKSAVSNKSAFCFENRIVKEDTSIIYVISKGVCFLDDANNFVRMVGTVQDITSQKLFEKTQTENQRLAAFSEMASSISHDFNNALQSMMGNLEIVKYQNKFSDATLERLNSIRTTITDVADRINALQSFGAIDDKVETEIINFNSIIKESIVESRPIWKNSMERKGLTIKITSDYGNIPRVDGIKGELKTVIYNLIMNSIEAMPQGGNIHIKTGTRAEGLFMDFTDTGIGMDEETQLKVFQPFYTTKKLERDRGLGLSGVFNIIKKHHGFICVKSSELGKGTSFEITLPQSNKVEINDVGEDVLTDDVASLNILWIDDELAILENASKLVELIGHNCDVADGSENALLLLNQNKYDVIFTDIGMPNMNGFQLSDAIRKKMGNRTKIVIVSGWNIDVNIKNKHDVNFVLQKPFTIKELKKALMSII